MPLVALISEFQVLNERMKAAFRTNAPIEDVSALFRLCTQKQAEIERSVARTPRESYLQLLFYLDRAREEASTAEESAALASACRLLDRRFRAYGDGPSTAAKAARPAALADYVAHAQGRVSLVGTDFRFIATSPANADFHGRPQAGFGGCHVAELVGPGRFENHLRPRFERTFGGEVQEHHDHAEIAPGRTGVIRSAYRPVRTAAGAVESALVYEDEVRMPELATA